jgi:hypothetical protein
MTLHFKKKDDKFVAEDRQTKNILVFLGFGDTIDADAFQTLETVCEIEKLNVEVVL